MADESWREQAKCRHMDTNLFFPTRVQDVGAATRVCNGLDGAPVCPAREACLEFALSLPSFDDDGVYGGRSLPERRRIRRARRRSAPSAPIQEGDGDDRHGTNTGFTAGCRCGRCRSARSAYTRAHRFGTAS